MKQQLEFICPVCDENIRFEIAKKDLDESQEWHCICPNCSLNATLSSSLLKRVEIDEN
jgi:hypothetical protein